MTSNPRNVSKTLNKNKPFERQIEPFNFMLVGSEVNDAIPRLPYRKDVNGIKFKKVVDYRIGKFSNELP